MISLLFGICLLVYRNDLARSNVRQRRWLKRWLGEALSSEWPRPAGSTWWAEGGSVKWVWTDGYCRAVFDYVDGQRASGPIVPRCEG